MLRITRGLRGVCRFTVHCAGWFFELKYFTGLKSRRKRNFIVSGNSRLDSNKI